jgi:hypothetical protein
MGGSFPVRIGTSGYASTDCPKIAFVDCEFSYSNGVSDNVRVEMPCELYFLRCTSKGAGKDGINYRFCNSVELDSTLYGNGYMYAAHADATLNYVTADAYGTNQGSTTHESAQVIRVDGNIYGNNQGVFDTGAPDARTITSTTNTSPISMVTSAAHGYTTGDSILQASTGVTAANGTFTITVTGATTYTLNGTTGTTSSTGGTSTPQNRKGVALNIGVYSYNQYGTVGQGKSNADFGGGSQSGDIMYMIDCKTTNLSGTPSTTTYGIRQEEGTLYTDKLLPAASMSLSSGTLKVI